jgi:hypothetical protein
MEPYMSINHQQNIPENVVDQYNEFHLSDTGIYMGENWPPEPEEEGTA